MDIVCNVLQDLVGLRAQSRFASMVGQMDLGGKYWGEFVRGRRGIRALNARGKELKEHEHLRHYRPDFTWANTVR
jgi:hypothetical protein